MQQESPRPMRPQYHFFYGSTGTADSSNGDNGDSNANTADNQSHRSNSIANEQESLLGESLVPTDNEEEPPNNSDFDLQHVLISNGTNNGMRHVVGGGSNHSPNLNAAKNGIINGSANSNYHPLNGKNGNGGSNGGNVNNFNSSWNQIRQSHPVFHIVGLVGCMTVIMVCFAITLFPAASINSTGESSLGIAVEATRRFDMKFPTVDRSKSNDPATIFLKNDLFHPSLHYSTGKDAFRIFQFPFPTGAFWTNLVLPSTADRGFSYPIAVYPYAYKWSETSLIVSYPALHRKEETKAIHDYFIPDLTFGVTEQVQQRYVTNFDPLSVTLQFQTSASTSNTDTDDSSLGKGSWQTFLVQGSPYTTLEYDTVTPRIKALSTFKYVACPGEEGMNTQDFDDNFSDDDGSHNSGGRRTRRRRRHLLGVCGVSTSSDGNGITTLRGVQFVLQTQEGVNWIVFASEPIAFEFDSRIRTEVISSKPFKGTLRLAVIPRSSKVEDSGNGMVQVSSSTGLRRLVYHASVYPVGAKVDYFFRDPSAPTTTNNVGKSVLSGITGNLGVLKTGAGITQPTKGEERVADVKFQFTTKTANSNAITADAATGKQTDLLMLSLPHHAFSFTQSHILDSSHFDLVYQCIKGAMTPVIGSVWTYEERLLSLGFEPSAHDASKSLDSILSNKSVRRLLAENLEDDVLIAPPTRTENIYGFGKQVARLAQLAHIADQLLGPANPINLGSNSSKANNTQSFSSAPLDKRLVSVRDAALQKLSENLELLFTDQLSDSLLYDASLGGMVSSDGIADFNADFGNGRYNDHHFHYGYLMFASAVMGRLNATFVEEHGARVDALMHDVAYNPKIQDGSFFPLARHMSWFDGHSFASGLFPFGNGKSQESSSEAVNCYYGAYLWSLVRSGSADKPHADISPTTDFARLLLAMEVRGAKTYWHMVPPSTSSQSSSSSTAGKNSSTTTTTTTAPDAFPTVYSPRFAKNYMVGNLGMLDAICSTWFGTENLYVHMINFLPVTPITRYLFNTEYVTKEYANVISNYPNAEMAWRGYVVADHALVAPMSAYKEAQKLISGQLDSGISKTQILYFILTSPMGFDVSKLGTSSSDSTSSSSSSNIPGDAMDGDGDNNGVSQVSGSDTASTSSSAGEAANCANHPACATTALSGLCCPTAAGTDLFCCHA